MTEFEQLALTALSEEVRRRLGLAPRLPDDKKSQKLGLALRRMVVSWVVEDKPRLVQSASAEGVLCYGGLQLARRGNRVELCGPSGRMRSEAMGVHSCGTSLVNEATTKVRLVYKAKLTTFMEGLMTQLTEEIPELAANDIVGALLINDYAGWVIDGSLEPKWWGNAASVANLTKLILKHAWDHKIFDKEVWGLAIRVGGVSPLLDDYNDIADNLEAVRARVQETPNLAPLLRCKDSRYRAETPLRADPQALSRERDRLIEAGCTPAGWRWLSKQARQWVYELHVLCSTEESVAIMNLMAEHQVGRLPVRFIRMAHLRAWAHPTYYWDSQLRGKRLSNEARKQSIGLFLKLAVHAVRSRKITAGTARDRATEILDFVADGNPIQKGATWQSLLRRQAEWHRAQHQARIAAMKAHRDTLPAYAWTPIVTEVQYKEFKAVSLKNSDELWAEGDYLEHCVGTYADRCFANESRIFSVRNEEGTSLATLELTHHRGRWTVAQLRGRRNASIANTVVKQLVQKVVTAVRQAPKADPSDNQVLREGTHRLRWERRNRQAALREAIPEDDAPIPF